MPVIFEGGVGQVIRIEDPAVQADIRLVNLPNTPITLNNQRAIITRMMLKHTVNVQVLRPLGAVVYIYVFGDRIGSLGLSGLCFAGDCTDMDPDEVDADTIKPGAE